MVPEIVHAEKPRDFLLLLKKFGNIDMKFT